MERNTHTRPQYPQRPVAGIESSRSFSLMTKYRRGALTQPILARCRQIMSETCEDSGATLTEFNGEEDHVHLLIQYPPLCRYRSS